MIWLGIIAIIFYGVGIVIRDSNMHNPMATKFAILMYYVGIGIFTFLIIVSIIGGIQSL
ncbi:MAG: hypothetical protein AAB483_02800 [Patescibacteria group bacterium]